MNKFFGIGRLTNDPDLRYTSSNIATATFTLAINRQYSNAQGEKETDYINVVIWRKQAENVKKYVNKGSLVAVDGRIQTRNYEDKDGKKVYVTEVVADNVQFLENKKNEQNGQAPQEKENEDDVYADFGNEIELQDSDLAF